MDKMKMETANKTLENLAKLKEMFPEVITESKDENGEIVAAVDAKKLEQLLSTKVIEGDECYDFTWVGKKQAMVEACKPIRKTLRPCRKESVDWENTQNLYIEGDNLDVLKLLQESYLNKVKMIYIDPPYNTGNDFIYNDSFVMDKDDYEEGIGLKDENELIQFNANNSSNPRFHSDWCSMMYSRLKTARNLLSNSGVLFISIDDGEVANLKKMCDEIYGESNFIGILIHQRAKGGGQAKYIVKGHDYILVYGKQIANINLARKKIIQQKTYEIDGEIYIKNTDVIRKVFGKYDRALGDRRCFYEELIQYKGIDKKKEVDEQLAAGELFLEENLDGTHTICRYEKVADASSKLYSIIKVLSEEGKKELDELGITGFSYPKPTELLRQLIEAGSYGKKDSIILDFFSGSATTAHAVMQLNAEDGGKRKFIMVQLPEVCDEKSEAYKAGYKNICEIGKERIRRAGKKIVEETGKKDLDIGFRVLKLDESNMKDVYFTPEEYKQTDLVDMVSNIKEGRTAEDLLYACMLEWGLELSLPHKVQKIAGFDVHIVNNGDLVACFADKISEEAIKQIAEMKPLRAVFRDSSFATDAARVNVGEIFKLKSPNTTIKVL